MEMAEGQEETPRACAEDKAFTSEKRKKGGPETGHL
jgi:hypothetical protein